MKGAVVLAIVLMGGAARADAPTVDAVKAALPAWTSAIAVPFTYQGMRYDDDVDHEKAAACAQAFGFHGVVKDVKKLPQFAACVAISTARDAFSKGFDVGVYDPKKGNEDIDITADVNADGPDTEIQKGYPKKLAKLAKKGGMFFSHAEKPDNVDGYWDQSWDVFVVHTDGGKVVFDAIVVVLSEQAPG